MSYSSRSELMLLAASSAVCAHPAGTYTPTHAHAHRGTHALAETAVLHAEDKCKLSASPADSSFFSSLSQKHVYVRADFCTRNLPCTRTYVWAGPRLCSATWMLWHAHVSVCASKCVGLMSYIRPLGGQSDCITHVLREASGTERRQTWAIVDMSASIRAKWPTTAIRQRTHTQHTHTPLDVGCECVNRARDGGKKTTNNIRTTGFVFLRLESHAWFPAGRSASCGTTPLRRS